eukprot:11924212-Alexandrium_andersonii.AAC.1
MASSTGPSASRGVAGLRPTWPVDVPTALKDLTAQMVEESVDQLLGQPEALVGAIVDQWQLDGGERSQQATDAVWSA